MTANLFLHPDGFQYNGSDTRPVVEGKLRSVVSDMTKVVMCYFDENYFKVYVSLATTQIYTGITVTEMAEQCLSNDEIGIFYTIMANTADECGLSMEQLRERCRYREDEQEVNSLLVLNRPLDDLSAEERATTEKEKKLAHKSIVTDYIEFDEYKIVYNSQTWMHLRRQIIGNHPGTAEEFIRECQKYFPQLFFHKNCVLSLVEDNFNYLELIPRRIIYYLSCLNDKFQDFKNSQSTTGDQNDLLENFSGAFGLDRCGSLQRAPKRKEDYTFNFRFKGKDNQVVCDHHLKIEREDRNKRNKNVNHHNFHPRIYFNYDNPEVANGKILVASIGKHL